VFLAFAISGMQTAHALSPIPTECVLEGSDRMAVQKRLLIRSQINSAKNDYFKKPDGFREILVNDLLFQTDRLCLDIVGYYVYTMLPDVK
jgi:hypothetical protein